MRASVRPAGPRNRRGTRSRPGRPRTVPARRRTPRRSRPAAPLVRQRPTQPRDAFDARAAQADSGRSKSSVAADDVLPGAVVAQHPHAVVESGSRRTSGTSSPAPACDRRRRRDHRHDSTSLAGAGFSGSSCSAGPSGCTRTCAFSAGTQPGLRSLAHLLGGDAAQQRQSFVQRLRVVEQHRAARDRVGPSGGGAHLVEPVALGLGPRHRQLLLGRSVDGERVQDVGDRRHDLVEVLTRQRPHRAEAERVAGDQAC